MSRPQNSFKHFPNPKNSPLGAKMKSKSKVRIESNIENESCSTTCVDQKTVVKPHPNPKIAHQGPKKSKRTPKLSQNQKSDLKEPKKIKFAQLNEQTKIQFLNPSSTPKIAHQSPKQSKRTPNLSKKKLELKKIQKIDVVQGYEQTQNHFFNNTLTYKMHFRVPKSKKGP